MLFRSLRSKDMPSRTGRGARVMRLLGGGELVLGARFFVLAFWSVLEVVFVAELFLAGAFFVEACLVGVFLALAVGLGLPVLFFVVLVAIIKLN